MRNRCKVILFILLYISSTLADVPESSSQVTPNSALLPSTSFTALNSSTDDSVVVEVTGPNCTSPAIEDFPRDIFTQTQRRHGFVLVHILVSIYIYYCLAKICDDYFVPCMERISEDLGIPSDVVGSTFMAISTSSPELFTNIVGTFVTEGDFGVGTVVGSAVFNIFGVCSVCGIFASSALPLEWYPLTRDCVFYSASIILLSIFLRDRRIVWWQAVSLLLLYALYIFVMFKNATLKRMTERLVHKIGTQFGFLQHDDSDHVVVIRKKTVIKHRKTSSTENPLDFPEKAPLLEASPAEPRQPFQTGGIAGSVYRLLSFPSRCLLSVTIPDCRRPEWRHWFPLTLFMCVLWIGVLSYVVNWMMTIIGQTFSIPDSVMGLTFIAAGTSIPEVVSCIIIVRKGLGGQMGISTSIGANTFDILVCLGLPWAIRCCVTASIITNESNFVEIHSAGLGYSVISLLISLAILYGALACNGFCLDRKIGFLALFLYACSLVLASMLEMNVFFTVNLPTCETDY